jgi:hypothetical protein
MTKKKTPSMDAANSESIKASIASAAYDRSTWTGISVGMDTSAASSAIVQVLIKGTGARSGPDVNA